MAPGLVREKTYRRLKAFDWNDQTALLNRPAPMRSRKLVIAIKNTVNAKEE